MYTSSECKKKNIEFVLFYAFFDFNFSMNGTMTCSLFVVDRYLFAIHNAT